MIFGEERLWSGSESSLHMLAAAEKAAVERSAFMGQPDDEEDPEDPRLLSIDGPVAVVTISGTLVNSDSLLLQYFGLTGYPEIRDALLTAARDPEVKQILLDVNSGGGAVSGVEDTAKLIRVINDKIKPVTAYAENAASAAYWLASSAGQVNLGRTSMMGSIGVIAVHKEYSDAYKKEGVGVNVVRAGKEKALANPHEKLSDKGRQQIQQSVDATYRVFVEHVAAMRGMSYEHTDTNAAQGKEFIGQSAVDVGLADKVTSFDAVIGDLKEKSLDQSKKFMDNRGKVNPAHVGSSSTIVSGEQAMGKKALTEQEIAALAAGAQIEAQSTAQVEDQEHAATETAAETNATESEANNGVQAQGQEAPEKVTKVDTSAEAVQLLMSQLQAKDEAIVQYGIKVAKLEEKLVGVEATHNDLRDIALKSLNNMRIALGGSAASDGAFGDADLVAEHKRVSEQFVSKFKAGGIAAVDSSAEKGETAVIDSVTKARLAATRFSK